MLIKLPTDLNEPFRIIFKHSYKISGFLLLIGLILDWQIGYEMLQRFGALVVGFGVIHYYANREIEEKIAVSEILQKKFKPRIERFLPCPIDANNPRYKGALQSMAASLHPTKPNKIAKEILDELITLQHELPRMRAKQKSIRWKEIATVLTGTVVWAFADLSTNFFIHCNYEFRCSQAETAPQNSQLPMPLSSGSEQSIPAIINPVPKP